MKKLNVGFVGFGFIGKVHACGYAGLPYYCRPTPLEARITHVCTSREQTALEGCRITGAQHALTDYRAVTENPDVDIVHICTPNHLHKDALMSAMRHQKHIYCDKPLTATLEEAEDIRAALPHYRGTAQMTLQNRFFPATIRAKQLIEQGFLGDLLEFRACYLHSGSADPAAALKWKNTASAGGGVIADLASHVMDLIRHLLGDYDELLASTHIAYAERPDGIDPSRRVKVDAEDSVMLLVRMKQGGLGQIGATKIATGTEDELRFEIHGSKGALRFNGMDPHHLAIYDATVADKPHGGRRGWTVVDTGQRYAAPEGDFPGPKFAVGWMRAHAACLYNFLRAVAEGRHGDPGLDQGIIIQQLIEAARGSARTNAWVKV